MIGIRYLLNFMLILRIYTVKNETVLYLIVINEI